MGPRCAIDSAADGPEGNKVSNEVLVAIVDDDDAFRTALVNSLDSLGYATH